MAIQALLVYNITQHNDKGQAQISAFVEAFKKFNVNLMALPNSQIVDYTDQHPNAFSFAVFWDKDIHISTYLEEELHMPVFNSKESIMTCDDKALTYLAFRNYSIPTPKTIILPYTFDINVLNYYDEVKTMIAKLTYPFIVKERFGSYGEQVYLVHSEEEFKALLSKVGKKPLLVQEYIAEATGRDYRVNVVGHEVITAVERYNPNDFRSNVNQGGTMTEVKLSPKLKKLAVDAVRAVGADFAGVDIVLDKDKKPLVLEVNTNARTLSVEKATGIYLTWYIARYVRHHFLRPRKIGLIAR
ncbi:MAG: RimK family alpha-L-glutamate ligase [Firmicutes bacterium]|nr:RimK family alpha-L-glutamate ligase [Bacillota bacterium]